MKALLPGAGLPASIPVQQIASPAGLSQGRSVLLKKCVQCHDLRTVLAKPRTPEGQRNESLEQLFMRLVGEADTDRA